MRKKLLIILIFIFISVQSNSIFAQENPTINMDFKETSISSLIEYISEATNKNFIVDKDVKGKVTVHSPLKLTLEEAFQTFESILTVHGFTLISLDNNAKQYQIVSVKNSIGRGGPVESGEAVPNQAGLLTHVVPLKYSSATELSKPLTKMLGQNGSVQAFSPKNTLVITAPSSTVKTILDVIKALDTSTHTAKLATFPLQHADATTISRSLASILSEHGATTSTQKLVIEYDTRTNSIIATGDQKTIAQLTEVIEFLDLPTPVGKSDIHFVNLNNADAKNIAEILNELISRNMDEDGKVTKLSRDIKIVADETTNSLIIMARPDEFITLEDTIKALDIKRRQVYIEALIMEVYSSSDFNIGVNWAVAGGDSVFWSTNLGGGSIELPQDSTKGFVGFPTGGSIGGVIDDAIKIGNTAYNIQAIISAVQTSSNYKILSTPQLLTLDNQQATVKVVDNVPYSSQSQTSNVNADYNSTQISYKDVGIMLEITPHISNNGTLRIEIKQEVSRIINSIVNLGDGNNIIAPTTKVREVHTTIQMQNNTTAVIAGLINDDSTYSDASVPFFSDIPGIGKLFKQKGEANQSTNLFIFIKPHIIASYEETRKLSESKKKIVHNVELGSDGLAPAQMASGILPQPIYINPRQ